MILIKDFRNLQGFNADFSLTKIRKREIITVNLASQTIIR
jgi:hypothetical protein